MNLLISFCTIFICSLINLPRRKWTCSCSTDEIPRFRFEGTSSITLLAQTFLSQNFSKLFKTSKAKRTARTSRSKNRFRMLSQEQVLAAYIRSSSTSSLFSFLLCAPSFPQIRSALDARASSSITRVCRRKNREKPEESEPGRRKIEKYKIYERLERMQKASVERGLRLFSFLLFCFDFLLR